MYRNRNILWIHFPVWRELKLLLKLNNHGSGAKDSEYTFPFEGNWNICILMPDMLFPISLNTLSRLKGIETTSSTPIQFIGLNSEYTFPFEGNWNAKPVVRVSPAPKKLWIHFPVWRELKRFYSFFSSGPIWRSLNTLSRLKGIETIRCHTVEILQDLLSEYTFPFEGNWNFSGTTRHRRPVSSEYTFPFEGNWNSSLGLVLLVLTGELWIHFPVWRELKPKILGISTATPATLNTLSRLKGIETLSATTKIVVSGALNTLSRLKGIETLTARIGISGSRSLWIHFPVWRELKLGFPVLPDSLSPLNTLSRLKGIET